MAGPSPASSASAAANREEVPIDLGRLPGKWRTKSPKDGHWTLNDDKQLYVSRTSLGLPQSEWKAEDRAAFEVILQMTTFEKLGSSDARIVSSHEITLENIRDGVMGCVVGTMSRAEGRVMACTFTVPKEPSVLTVEVSFYGAFAESAFIKEAMPIVDAARAQVPPWAPPIGGAGDERHRRAESSSGE